MQLGRWHGVDAFTDRFPEFTPYRYAFNNPLKYIDLGGNFEISAEVAKAYPGLKHFLQFGIQAIAKNPTIMNGLKKYGGYSDQEVLEALEFGKGPEIIIGNTDGALGMFIRDEQTKDKLFIDTFLMKRFQKSSGLDKEIYLLMISITILHEFVHRGDYIKNINRPGEEGDLFEIDVYGEDMNGFDSAKRILERWLRGDSFQKNNKNNDNEEKEDRNKKATEFNKLISDFDNLSEGTYTWNGTKWKKKKEKIKK